MFYGFGRWYDEQRLRVLVRKYGKWLLLQESDLNRASEWFLHYGELAVFFGRMVPIVRNLISVPAGMAHMNGLRFTFYTALGAAAWNLVLAMAGRLLGQGWALVSDLVERFQNLTIMMAVIALGAFLARRLFQQVYMRSKK